jgi:hypothetical protein
MGARNLSKTRTYSIPCPADPECPSIGGEMGLAPVGPYHLGGCFSVSLCWLSTWRLWEVMVRGYSARLYQWEQ